MSEVRKKGALLDKLTDWSPTDTCRNGNGQK